MESILLLKKFIGYQRTLIITCPECRNYLEEGKLISTYFCLGGMLRRHDQHQEECIQYHIEKNSCTHIVITGHHSCQVVKRIRDDHAQNISSPYMLEWKTDVLLRDHARKFLRHEVKDQMITEINVLEQVQVLLNFHFVKPLVEKGLVSVSGIIIDEKNYRLHEIFRNGIVFNDLIGSN